MEQSWEFNWSILWFGLKHHQRNLTTVEQETLPCKTETIKSIYYKAPLSKIAEKYEGIICLLLLWILFLEAAFVSDNI